MKTVSQKWISFSLFYAAIIMMVVGYLNFMEPYDPIPSAVPSATQILLWTSLYLPTMVLPFFPQHSPEQVGLGFNKNMVLVAMLSSLLCGLMTLSHQATWIAAGFEAFARTGEEFFFRGTIYFLLEALFASKRHPWLWAVIGSAFLFTLIHTQTFQISYLGTLGDSPLLYRIIERLFNIFLIAIVIAFIRYWTKSILPGAIIHGMLNAGVMTLPFTLLFYVAGWLWLNKFKPRFAMISTI